MATGSTEWNARVLVEREDREAVLAAISASPSLTIEELLHRLPWMRWGHLFSILRECLQEGLVTLRQTEFQFEVMVIHSLQRESEETLLPRPVQLRSDNRGVTI